MGVYLHRFNSREEFLAEYNGEAVEVPIEFTVTGGSKFSFSDGNETELGETHEYDGVYVLDSDITNDYIDEITGGQELPEGLTVKMMIFKKGEIKVVCIWQSYNGQEMFTVRYTDDLEWALENPNSVPESGIGALLDVDENSIERDVLSMGYHEPWVSFTQPWSDADVYSTTGEGFVYYGDFQQAMV